MAAAEMDEDEKRIIDNFGSFRYREYTDVILLSRFQQGDALHRALGAELFADVSKQRLCQFLNAGSTYNGPPGTDMRPYITIDNIDKVNIRFATFAFQFGGAGNVVLLDTEELPGFYNLNLRALVTQGVITIDSPLIQCLIQKILSEHNVREQVVVDPPNTPVFFITSIDVYYDRSSKEAGRWHRDATPYEMTEHASLEFYTPPGACYLGPEMLFLPYNPGNELQIGTQVDDKMIERVLDTYPERRKTSLRCLATDGTIFMFDNLRMLHATPITQNPETMFTGRNAVPTTVVINGQVTNLQTMLHNTEHMERSFIRSWTRHVEGAFPVGINVLLQGGVPLIIYPMLSEFNTSEESLDELHKLVMGGLSKRNLNLVNFRIQAPLLTTSAPWVAISEKNVNEYIKNETNQIKDLVKRIRNQKKVGGRRKKSKQNKKSKKKSKKRRFTKNDFH